LGTAARCPVAADHCVCRDRVDRVRPPDAGGVHLDRDAPDRRWSQERCRLWLQVHAVNTNCDDTAESGMSNRVIPGPRIASGGFHTCVLLGDSQVRGRQRPRAARQRHRHKLIDASDRPRFLTAPVGLHPDPDRDQERVRRGRIIHRALNRVFEFLATSGAGSQTSSRCVVASAGVSSRRPATPSL